MSWYTGKAFWSFVGGIAAAAAAKTISQQPKAREVIVGAVAKGMEAHSKANADLQSIKDDAADLAAESRRKAQIDAMIADRRRALEEKIREQVEAEYAEMEEQIAKEAAGQTSTSNTPSLSLKQAAAALKAAREKAEENKRRSKDKAIASGSLADTFDWRLRDDSSDTKDSPDAKA